MGLNWVRRLAGLHGGRAWVDDRPGGGARFCVTLPDPAVPASSEATTADGVPGGSVPATA